MLVLGCTQFIANPIKQWGYVNKGRKSMMLLKYKVLDSTLLRRTKTERAADLALPPRTVGVQLLSVILVVVGLHELVMVFRLQSNIHMQI